MGVLSDQFLFILVVVWIVLLIFSIVWHIRH